MSTRLPGASSCEESCPSPKVRLKVIVLPSGLTVHDSASPGTGFRAKSYSRRSSYTLVATWPIGPDVLMLEASVGGSGLDEHDEGATALLRGRRLGHEREPRDRDDD